MIKINNIKEIDILVLLTFTNVLIMFILSGVTSELFEAIYSEMS